MWVKNLHDSPAEILPIIARMREADRAEIFATRFSDCPIEFADDVLAAGAPAWISGTAELGPIAAFGACERWPGMYDMWLFSTDDFQHIGKSMTKLIKDVIVPELFGGGGRRLECRSMEKHRHAHKWLTAVGARHEGDLPNYGKGGEAFRVFAWAKPDVL